MSHNDDAYAESSCFHRCPRCDRVISSSPCHAAVVRAPFPQCLMGFIIGTAGVTMGEFMRRTNACILSRTYSRRSVLRRQGSCELTIFAHSAARCHEIVAMAIQLASRNHEKRFLRSDALLLTSLSAEEWNRHCMAQAVGSKQRRVGHWRVGSGGCALKAVFGLKPVESLFLAPSHSRHARGLFRHQRQRTGFDFVPNSPATDGSATRHDSGWDTPPREEHRDLMRRVSQHRIKVPVNWGWRTIRSVPFPL